MKNLVCAPYQFEELFALTASSYEPYNSRLWGAKSDTKKYCLMGPINKVTVETRKFTKTMFGKVSESKGPSVTCTLEFDYDGSLRRITSKEGRVEQTRTYRYNKGTLMEILDSMGMKTAYRYDEARRLSEVIHAKGEKIWWRKQYGYNNSTDDLASQFRLYFNEQLSTTEVMEYNLAERWVVQTTYDARRADNKPHDQCQYKYTYNDSGRIIKEQTLMLYGLVQNPRELEREYSYDADGNLIKSKFYVYVPEACTLHAEREGGPSRKTQRIYEFDSLKNWIRWTEHVENDARGFTPAESVTRIIEYSK